MLNRIVIHSSFFFAPLPRFIYIAFNLTDISAYENSSASIRILRRFHNPNILRRDNDLRLSLCNAIRCRHSVSCPCGNNRSLSDKLTWWTDCVIAIIIVVVSRWLIILRLNSAEGMDKLCKYRIMFARIFYMKRQWNPLEKCIRWID